MKKSDDKEQKKSDVSPGDEWKIKYLRALADYQNLEKRIEASHNENRRSAAERLLKELLPVVDVLEKAQEHIADQGLGLAVKELWKVLQSEGVTKIQVTGREFNPYEMECVEVVEGEEGKVIEEVSSGYKLHDKVLRVAKVKAGKKIENLAHKEEQLGS